MKIDRVFNSKQEEEREEKFYKAIMTLSNLNEHKAFLLKHNIKFNDNNKKLPNLYITPKQHKNP